MLFFFSSYLLLPNIQIVGELAIMGSAICGALIAFLWFNSYPAEIFMEIRFSSFRRFHGYMAIIAKSGILLVAIGFIFVLETISVILQVGSYKLRQKEFFNGTYTSSFWTKRLERK